MRDVISPAERLTGYKKTLCDTRKNEVLSEFSDKENYKSWVNWKKKYEPKFCRPYAV